MKRIKTKALIFTLAAAVFIAAAPQTARADEGDVNIGKGHVTFTKEKKMDSDFRNHHIEKTFSGLQPGDSREFEITIKNENPSTTDWYMSNKVIQSLEEANKAAAGGGYTYYLSYTDSKKKETILYNSNRVGGDEKTTPDGTTLEGLHQATNQMEVDEEYFFLDDLKEGQSGKVLLKIELDGETQGNDYQDTMAELGLKFAVELPETGSQKKQREIKRVNRTVREMRNAVKTGDERNMLPYFIIGAISGLILLLVGFYSLSLRKKECAGTASAQVGREE